MISRFQRSVLTQVVLYDRLSNLNLSSEEEGQDIETLVRFGFLNILYSIALTQTDT